jgi:hypothetical protein
MLRTSSILLVGDMGDVLCKPAGDLELRPAIEGC